MNDIGAKVLRAVITTLAIGSLAVVPSLAVADEAPEAPVLEPAPPAEPVAPLAGCPGGQFCGYQFANFGGSYTTTPFCSGAGGVNESYSAKNNCGSPIRLGWSEGGGINWKFCMNPGGERPDPGRFNFYTFQGSC